MDSFREATRAICLRSTMQTSPPDLTRLQNTNTNKRHIESKQKSQSRTPNLQTKANSSLQTNLNCLPTTPPHQASKFHPPGLEYRLKQKAQGSLFSTRHLCECIKKRRSPMNGKEEEIAVPSSCGTELWCVPSLKGFSVAVFQRTRGGKENVSHDFVIFWSPDGYRKERADRKSVV